MKQKFTKLFLVLIVVLTRLTFFGRAANETELTTTTSPEVASETPTKDNDTTENHFIDAFQVKLLEMYYELSKESSKSEWAEGKKKLNKMIEKLDGLFSNGEENNVSNGSSGSINGEVVMENKTESNHTSSQPTMTTTTSGTTESSNHTSSQANMTTSVSVINTTTLSIDLESQTTTSGNTESNDADPPSTSGDEAASDGSNLSSKNKKKRFYQSTPFLFFLFISIIIMVAFYFGYVSRRKITTYFYRNLTNGRRMKESKRSLEDAMPAFGSLKS